MDSKTVHDHNLQKKAAVISDFSSFGRCSLAVAAPVLSAMGVQCCPVPTAIFTNHTGFKSFSYSSCDGMLGRYIEDWRSTGLAFSAIASGYLMNSSQIDFVNAFIDAFRDDRTLLMVDPVMGDYGKLYPSFSTDVAAKLRNLAERADVITPNLTEACILASRRYDPSIKDKELVSLAEELAGGTKKTVVISGIQRAGSLLNFIYTPGGDAQMVSVPKVGPDRSGTGDVFSSVVLGALVGGCGIVEAVKKAAGFILKTVTKAEEIGIPPTDGLPVEETLHVLYKNFRESAS